MGVTNSCYISQLFSHFALLTLLVVTQSYFNCWDASIQIVFQSLSNSFSTRLYEPSLEFSWFSSPRQCTCVLLLAHRVLLFCALRPPVMQIRSVLESRMCTSKSQSNCSELATKIDEDYTNARFVSAFNGRWNPLEIAYIQRSFR